MQISTEKFNDTLTNRNLGFGLEQKFIFKKILGCLSMIVLLILIGSQTTQTYAQTCSTAPANLVSWYRAENNALDSKGANNGTIQGNVTFTNGYVGQTFTLGGNGDLSGNGDRVLVGNPANLQLQDFTIEAWIKRSNSTIVTNSPVAGFEGGTFFAYGLNGYGFVIQQSTNRIGLTNVGASAVYSTATVSDTNFHHVAVTKSGNQVTFYIDGVADAPVTYNTTFSFTTNAAIGTRGDNDTRNAFFGSIDELSIYNRPLTAAEIQAIVAADTAGKCLAPTAANATVSGRVTTNGRGIVNVFVRLTDGQGNFVTARTNPFGYFRFENVEVGQTYIAEINSKQYVFSPQVITVNDNITDLNFSPITQTFNRKDQIKMSGNNKFLQRK